MAKPSFINTGKNILSLVKWKEGQRIVKSNGGGRMQDGGGVGDLSIIWPQKLSYIAIKSFPTCANSTGYVRKDWLQLYK